MSEYNSNEVTYFRVTYKPTAEATYHNTNLIKAASASEARNKVYELIPDAIVVGASPVFNGVELDSYIQRGMPILGESKTVTESEKTTYLNNYDFTQEFNRLKDEYAEKHGWLEDPYWYEDDEHLYDAECYAYDELEKNNIHLKESSNIVEKITYSTELSTIESNLIRMIGSRVGCESALVVNLGDGNTGIITDDDNSGVSITVVETGHREYGSGIDIENYVLSTWGKERSELSESLNREDEELIKNQILKAYENGEIKAEAIDINDVPDNNMIDIDTIDISQGTGNVMIRLVYDYKNNKLYKYADF